MGKNELPKVSPYTRDIFIFFIFLAVAKRVCRWMAIVLGMLHSMRLNFLSWHYLPRLHPFFGASRLA